MSLVKKTNLTDELELIEDTNGAVVQSRPLSWREERWIKAGPMERELMRTRDRLRREAKVADSLAMLVGNPTLMATLNVKIVPLNEKNVW